MVKKIKIAWVVLIIVVMMFTLFISINTKPAEAASNDAVLLLNLSRYVVLDDPHSGQADTANGFSNPPQNWANNYWYGESTTIRGYALLVNSSGGVPNVDVTFTVKKPDGSIAYSITIKTNSSGLATFSFDLDEQNYYGYWTVEANTTVNGKTLTASQRFIYNWWGCVRCHGDSGVGSGADISGWNAGGEHKSPYTMGYNRNGNSFHMDPRVGMHADVMVNGWCSACHNGYDGTHVQGEWNDTQMTTQYPSGIHNNKKACQDCHVNADAGNQDAEIAGCYDTAGCHAQKNTKLTEIFTTTGYSVGGTYKTIYSLDTTTGQPKKAHTPAETVPCINCHGPAHMLSKPYNASWTSNNYTEDEQCLTCHIGRGKHSTSNPVYCTACHSQDVHNISILDKNSPSQPAYTFIGSINAVNKSDCLACHSTGAIANFFASLTTYDNQAYTKNYNTTYDRFGYMIAKHNGVVDCLVCHDNTDFHSITFLTHSGTYSTNKTQAVSCEDCHVPGVNDTVKSVVQSKGYNPPQVDSKHDSVVPCEVCHSPSPHGGARFLSSDLVTYTTNRVLAVNCTDCHINPGASGKTYTTRAGTYTMYPPYIGDFAHSNSDVAGQKWGNYWNSTVEACYFCHTKEIHTSKPLGNVTNIQGSNTLNSSLTVSTWCANCHYTKAPEYNGTAYTPIPPRVDVNEGTASDGTPWYNHSKVLERSYVDKMCFYCHGGNLSNNATIKEFVHNVSIGVKGGPDCIKCHDIGKSAAPDIDFNATVFSAHKDLNKDVATNLSAENKKCWACHADGSEPPAGDHPARFMNPRVCEDCHLTGLFGAPIVSNHINKSTVNVRVYAECYDCHSLDENQITSNDLEDPIYYTSIDIKKAKASHYVKNRDSELDSKFTEQYCGYCHLQQIYGSTPSSYPFSKSYTSRMPYHESRMTKYYVSCAKCHGYGMGNLHVGTLEKPVLSEFKARCPTCHIGAGAHKNHGSLECLACHINTSGKVHNASYLTESLTYEPAKIVRQNKNWIKCTTCHNSSAADSILAQFGKSAKKITFYGHGDGASGSTVYWSTAEEACKYCHAKNVHADIPILQGAMRVAGRFSGDYPARVNTTQFNTSTWCLSCHDQSDSDYSITVNSFIVTLMKNPKPPLMAANCTGTTDRDCATCHYNGSESEGMDKFMHSVVIK